MLTRKQYELLVFIDARLKAGGVSPSFDEMKDALGLKSKSGIHRLITGLEERGFIRRLPHRARALEVVRLPDNMGEVGKPAPARPPRRPGGDVQPFAPNVIEGGFRLPGAIVAARTESVQVPLYGKIAAGAPIEAMRDQSNHFEVPAGLLTSGEHYALEVEGDSMIEAGIHDGDVAIIRHAETAENGAIVVALVDNDEVTLKRLRRKGQSIALEPANKTYGTRIFGPDRVKVQGKLVALFRKY